MPALHPGGIGAGQGESVTDIFSAKKRSAVMSRIRSTRNATTEIRVVAAFRRRGLHGWRRHPKGVRGSPDFVFPGARLAIHVHGCFWHGCPSCAGGHVPKTNKAYWKPKLRRNRLRDAKNRRALRQAGYSTVQIWEHELRSDIWLKRVERRMAGK